MGLDAYVQCRCWQDGLVEPPFDPALVYLDEDGYLSFRGSDDLWGVFDDWRTSGCPHRDMDFAAEHISNWYGYRMFQGALEYVGLQHFPVLDAELPNNNGGMLSPASAAVALAELAYFTEQKIVGRNSRVVDLDSGAELWAYVPGYDGVFFHSKDFVIGIDHEGVFVRDTTHDPAVEILRAMRLHQRAVTSQDGKKKSWTELDDGRHRLVLPIEPLGVHAGAAPSGFRVEIREESPKDYEHITGALSRLFHASVESGNPVIWT